MVLEEAVDLSCERLLMMMMMMMMLLYMFLSVSSVDGLAVPIQGSKRIRWPPPSRWTG
jgi:hypothetical protein